MPSGRNFLFGAGYYALSTKHYLEKQGIRFDGVIVTKKNCDIFDGTPVFEPDEVSGCSSDCCVFFALGEKFHCEVEKMLRSYGFDNFVKYSDDELCQHYYAENNLERILIERYKGKLPARLDKPKSWNRILVIRLDGIGDMVMTTPFFRELRRNCPKSHITLITSKISYNLFECCPYLDNVIPLNWKDELINSSDVLCQLENSENFIRRSFGEESFDAVIVPRYDVDHYGASYLALFSGAPYRVAFSEKVNKDKMMRNKYCDLIFSKTISVPGVFHEVERNIQVLHAMGLSAVDDSLELWVEEKDYQTVNEILKIDEMVFQRKIIAIGLSASNKYKIWPNDKYVSLIKEIIANYSKACLFVLLGGKEEIERAVHVEEGVSDASVINLCGKVSLRQEFVIMKYAALYIGHDTGLMHIAAAAHCAVVEICATPPIIPTNHFSSTLRFGPWQTKNEIIRPRDGYWDDGWRNVNGDFAICDITVDEVMAVVEKML